MHRVQFPLLSYNEQFSLGAIQLLGQGKLTQSDNFLTIGTSFGLKHFKQRPESSTSAQLKCLLFQDFLKLESSFEELHMRHDPSSS